MGFTAAVAPLVAGLAAARSAARSCGLYRVPHSHIFVGRQFACVRDFDVEDAQFQAVTDPYVNTLVEGKVLDVGFAYQSKVIRGSLSKLTGQNPGCTAHAWLDWWEENGDERRAADRSAPDAGTRRTAARRTSSRRLSARPPEAATAQPLRFPHSS